MEVWKAEDIMDISRLMKNCPLAVALLAHLHDSLIRLQLVEKLIATEDVGAIAHICHWVVDGVINLSIIEGTAVKRLLNPVNHINGTTDEKKSNEDIPDNMLQAMSKLNEKIKDVGQYIPQFIALLSRLKLLDTVDTNENEKDNKRGNSQQMLSVHFEWHFIQAWDIINHILMATNNINSNNSSLANNDVTYRITQCCINSMKKIVSDLIEIDNLSDQFLTAKGTREGKQCKLFHQMGLNAFEFESKFINNILSNILRYTSLVSSSSSSHENDCFDIWQAIKLMDQINNGNRNKKDQNGECEQIEFLKNWNHLSEFISDSENNNQLELCFNQNYYLISFVELLFQLTRDNLYGKTLLLSVIYQVFVVNFRNYDVYQFFLSLHARYVSFC